MLYVPVMVNNKQMGDHSVMMKAQNTRRELRNQNNKIVYFGLHMTHAGCTLPNKSLIMLTHSRKDCST